MKHQVARLLEFDEAAYTCPIYFELLSGVKSHEESDLQQAFAMSHHFPFETNDWKEAAILERQFRSKGLVIPRNDLFVVVVAVRSSLVVVCRDSHFNLARKITGDKLKVEQV